MIYDIKSKIYTIIYPVLDGIVNLIHKWLGAMSPKSILCEWNIESYITVSPALAMLFSRGASLRNVKPRLFSEISSITVQKLHN